MADNLQGLIDSIVTATAGLPDPATLASWTPALSGDIDIVIERDGGWRHNGSTIHREGLIRLFASLLRRETDGDYYLVTPAEKWRVQVVNHPLVGIDCDKLSDTSASSVTDGDGTKNRDDWYLLLNTGGRCRIGGVHALHVDEEPFLDLPNGLSAQLTRAAWYRLVNSADLENDRASIVSSGERIDLGPTA